ncbi:MAG: bifunctional hydroxymethylpyrimidine kinase/phosphomethylpyrimidine kinase [Rhodospirillaceae bacterium]|nr:bifunctional hydroxymethylpyrimidine kinase/phosphomethylpyrimidine kinase [Rhodospirillaceae bacterium]
MIRNVLSIAGSDPSGGAGIQADLKTFSALGVYGMAAMTSLTAQNTRGVRGVIPVPVDFVVAQIEAIFDDVRVDAVKIGMIFNAEIGAAVADVLAHRPPPFLVLDPVMVARGGEPLLDPDAVAVIATRLLPLADIVTPNLPEAAALLDDAAAPGKAEMAGAAERLLGLGAKAVLLKGGHLDGADSADCLATAGGVVWLDGPRHRTANTHGTGCTLSSALAARLALGDDLAAAARAAKTYVADAIAASGALTVGHGHGPTHHFHTLWRP